MRYFKHLALWTVCGLVVVGLAGALAGASVGAVSAWVTWEPLGLMSGVRSSDTVSGAFVGGILGGGSGAICCFVWRFRVLLR